MDAGNFDAETDLRGGGVGAVSIRGGRGRLLEKLTERIRVFRARALEGRAVDVGNVVADDLEAAGEIAQRADAAIE